MQDVKILLQKLELVNKMFPKNTYMHGSGKNIYFSSKLANKLCTKFDFYKGSYLSISPYIEIDFENTKLQIKSHPNRFTLISSCYLNNKYEYIFTKYTEKLYAGIFSDELVKLIEPLILDFISSTKLYPFNYNNLPDKLKNLVLFT